MTRRGLTRSQDPLPAFEDSKDEALQRAPDAGTERLIVAGEGRLIFLMWVRVEDVVNMFVLWLLCCSGG